MSKPKIGVIVHKSLVRQLFAPEQVERLNALGQVTWTQSEKPIDVDAAIEILRDCEIAIGGWQTPHPGDARLIEACPELRLWEHSAGTVKHMFGPHLRGRNLMIASCAPANAEAVAEFTLCELMAGLKRIYENAQLNRSAITPKPRNSRSLRDCTVGIIAASEVGRRVIALLKQFKANVLLYDPYVTEQAAREMGATLLHDLVELCAKSDAVSLHAPITEATVRMLRSEHFQAMRDDCLFINTARGVLVDEPALIAELRKGRLFAMLDVTEPEPPAIDSPLRKLPNCLYTSHIAGMAEFRLGEQAVDDVERFIRGQRPLRVVTEDMLSYIA